MAEEDGLLKVELSPPSEEGPLQLAVRGEIERVLSTSLTIASLTRLSRLCSGAISLLGAKHQTTTANMSMGAIGYDVAEPNQFVSPSLTIGGGGAENFGANLLREAVSAFSEWKKGREPEFDAYTATLAIRNASELGMDDVVEKLKQQLRDKLACGPKLLVPGEDAP